MRWPLKLRAVPGGFAGREKPEWISCCCHSSLVILHSPLNRTHRIMARQCTPPAFLEQKCSTPALGHTREPESKGPVTEVKKEHPMSVSPPFSWHLRNADFAVSDCLAVPSSMCSGTWWAIRLPQGLQEHCITEKTTNNHYYLFSPAP